MLGAEGVHSTWATKVSLGNRTLGRPETIARPRLLSVLQPPRLIPRRDSPRSTEAPAQCRPRRWDPGASRSRPQQHRQQRAGRRPAPLQGPTASRAREPALRAECPPYAHALPRAHSLSSHSAAVPTLPPPRVPEAHRAPTHPVFGVPRHLPCREAAAPGALEARGALSRARCCRERKRFLPAAPAPAPGAGSCSKRAGRSSATRALRRKTNRPL